MPSERPHERLGDILENATRIVSHAGDLTLEEFCADHLRRDAVERCVCRISEAARKLGAVAEVRMPEHPWFEIRAIGNVLRHAYDDVDPAVIWRIAKDNVPGLVASVRRVLADLDAGTPT